MQPQYRGTAAAPDARGSPAQHLLNRAQSGLTHAASVNAVAALAIYTLTMFVSAMLLFLVQPMFAKMVLPLLGGSPAVWNTAIVVYQVMLLAGYCYAHAATRWLGVRRQAALHAVLILLPLLVLPIAVPTGWNPPSEGNPIPWLLAVLIVAVGLPFFVVSATSPLLQAWFAHTGHPRAGDPYFLYAASNVGSMLALLGYPMVAEPHVRLAEQSRLWAGGYALLVVLMLGCAVMVWRSRGTRLAQREPEAEDQVTGPGTTAAGSVPIRAGRRLRWVLLAFVPSSLMLSVTTYLTGGIAPIPLLWVIPLAIYLLTFILVFQKKVIVPQQRLVRWLPGSVPLVTVVLTLQANNPIWLLIPLHLGAFFMAAMVCHGDLAADRPSAAHVTEFYLWLSVGGALGGVFNALLAPVLFSTVLEYPMVLVLLCLLYRRPHDAREQPSSRRLDVGLPVALGLMTGALTLGVRAAGLPPSLLTRLLLVALPVCVCLKFARRPVRFALGIAAVMLAGSLYPSELGSLVHAERSFFGISRVRVDADGRHHMLMHGDTMHGMQSLDPARRREPLTYYDRSGPIGQVFAAFDGADTKQRVAVVGLGTGSLACYSRPRQEWTFYEIDPVVARIARNPRYFTFLEDCAPSAGVVLGDARLSLTRAPEQHYNLIILDAYSADSIPVHLLTREALRLYLDKLSPDGVLAFHISNRYLDLQPVVGRLAQDAGLMGLGQGEPTVSKEESARGKYPSRWVVVARTSTDLGRLVDDPRWQRLDAEPDVAVWTDDFSSILSVLRLR